MADALPRLTAALAGRYRIEREIGAGGMATVYLAQDLKHDRKVALKVLKPELAAVLGAERFVQEIKTTAALQHPHILPLFDSGTADGFLFYVMPFIDGETLRSKLDRETQLGVDEAVRLATDVASALQYAHTHGVIHRDIKPENILLHDGRPMVADFGIALAVSAAAGGRMTETGLSLGTPHYMSPEQATAEKDISARSDVYSLASVLYEMLAGQPPHLGGSAQQIIMKIIAEPVEAVTRYRKTVPPHVAAAVAKSLEKLPADRFESAKAFAEALANPAFMTAGTAAAVSAGVPRRIFVLTAAVAVLALAVAAWGWLRPTPEAGVSRSSIVLWRARFASIMEAGVNLVEGQAAIAPDGSSIVFSDSVAGGFELRRKRRQESGSEPIPGTKGGHAPFFSPDGVWIGYLTEDGRLRKVPAAGGGAIDVVSDANTTYLAAAWMDDGTIVYVDSALNVRRVSADGGRSRIIVPLSAIGNRNVSAMSPLPDSRGVLLTTCPGNCVTEPAVAVLDLRTDSVRVLVEAAAGAWFAPSGHLLYTLAAGGLYAVGFKLDALQTVGGAVSVLDGVSPAEFTLARSGAVLYSTGGNARSANLVWVTRTGSVEVIDPEWRTDFLYPELSPDGRTIAVSVTDQTTQLWVRRSDGGRQKLTLDGTINWRPTWSADGRTVAFVGVPLGGRKADYGTMEAFQVPADGSGPPRPLLAQARTWEVAYSRDGRWLLDRTDNEAGTASDLHARRLDGDSARKDLIAGRGSNRQPALSPDSRWLAYVSMESGRYEVYLTSFPDPKVKRLVSRGGGQEPRWSASGRELFFKSGGSLVAVDVPAGPSLAPGVPRPLFPLVRFRAAQNRQQYDVAPDGQRFLMIRSGAGDAKQELIYAENWFQELRAKMKVK